MTTERVIKLNIGGVSYCTYHDTLKRSPYFMNLLDGEMKRKTVVNEDEIFIDRNGVLFEHVIDYLRTGSLECIQDDRKTLNRLRHEAEYYQLKDLIDSIDGKGFTQHNKLILSGLSENVPMVYNDGSKTGQQDATVKMFMDVIGEQPTLKLAFATQMRVDLGKVQVECNGRVKGLQRVEDIGKRIGWGKHCPLPLGILAASLPFASLYMIEAMREKGLNVDHLKKDKDSSLPVELQTTEAVALPLGPKTRRAHLKFNEKQCRGMFDADHYRIQMASCFKFKTNAHIKTILDRIEREMDLTEQEKEATLSPFIPELEEKTIEKITEFFDLFKTK